MAPFGSGSQYMAVVSLRALASGHVLKVSWLMGLVKSLEPKTQRPESFERNVPICRESQTLCSRKPLFGRMIWKTSWTAQETLAAQLPTCQEYLLTLHKLTAISPNPFDGWSAGVLGNPGVPSLLGVASVVGSLFCVAGKPNISACYSCASLKSCQSFTACAYTCFTEDYCHGLGSIVTVAGVCMRLCCNQCSYMGKT